MGFLGVMFTGVSTTLLGHEHSSQLHWSQAGAAACCDSSSSGNRMHPGCMSPEPGLVGVRLATMLADVRPLAGVGPPVDQVGTAESERPVARFTVERTLVGMHA